MESHAVILSSTSGINRLRSHFLTLVFGLAQFWLRLRRFVVFLKLSLASLPRTLSP